MFFRAVAVMDTLPERAAKDFQTLLRRRAWVEAERRVGGGRIIFAGDALLRLGQAQEAIHAYELVGDSPPPEVKERLAVALVYAEVLHHAEPPAILSVADRALSLAPDSPWPRLLAMLGLLIAGDVNSALPRLEAAEERGAPEIACRCLRSLCAIVSGTPATVTDKELAALRLPREAEAVIRLLCDAEPEPTRIEAFVRALGEAWITHCPTDPSLMARRLLTAWCDDGKWDEALRFADELAHSSESWAVELATLARVRHALERAGRGELEEAERELRELEVAL
jgi:tetratricopeptide (TPR) repeat protein